MPQDMNPHKVRSLMEGIQRASFGKPPEVQAAATAEAFLYAFQTIERLEARIADLERAHVASKETAGEQ